MSSRAAIAHAGPQAAHKLVQKRAERTFVRHAALDALRHEFSVHLPFPHRPADTARSNPCTIAPSEPMPRYALYVASLVEHSFARAFVEAGEQSADHDGVRSGREWLS